MQLKYKRARRHTNRGPFIHILGGGKTVMIELGGVVEVSDPIGHQLLGSFGDILERLDDPPEVSKPEVKVQKVVKKVQDKQVKAYADKSELAEL